MHNGDRFRLDMTPLVDVAFLLLTFFMFATTMSEPRIMEVAVPPDITGIPVRESDLLTILKVDPDARYEAVVAVLDRLNLAEGQLADQYAKRGLVRERRFSIMPIEPAVAAAIDRLAL